MGEPLAEPLHIESDPRALMRVFKQQGRLRGRFRMRGYFLRMNPCGRVVADHAAAASMVKPCPATMLPIRHEAAKPCFLNSDSTSASVSAEQATSSPPLVCGSVMSARIQSGAPSGRQISLTSPL